MADEARTNLYVHAYVHVCVCLCLWLRVDADGNSLCTGIYTRHLHQIKRRQCLMYTSCQSVPCQHPFTLLSPLTLALSRQTVMSSGCYLTPGGVCFGGRVCGYVFGWMCVCICARMLWLCESASENVVIYSYIWDMYVLTAR